MAVESVSRPFVGLPGNQQGKFVQSVAKRLYASRKPPQHPTANTHSTVTVVCISDTHNTQPELPDGDILLHAGDLSQYGLFDEIQAQLNWLNSQPHKSKIVIAGNHDRLLDTVFVKTHPDRELDKSDKRREDLQWGDVTYLQNSHVDLKIGNRTLKIYGSPLTPRFGSFAFQYNPKDDMWTDTVPADTDILLTHGPPAWHLDDEGKGCKYLLKELWKVKPCLAVFGHIHAGRGEQLVWLDDVQACYENVMLKRRPWANLFMLAWHIFWQALTRTFDTVRIPDYSYLVNAAVVGGQYNQDRRGPLVVYV